MDQSLKQRLVGALVFLSLAIIFLPLVFDGQTRDIETEQYRVPPKPEITIRNVDVKAIEERAASTVEAIKSVAAEKQQQNEDLSSEPQNKINSDTETPKASSNVADYIEQEKTKDAELRNDNAQPLSLADAWTIQVGAFSSKKYAHGLRDKLLAEGYKAYVKPVNELFKVYVGPEIRKYRVEQQQTQLEQLLGSKTLILKYIP